MQNTVSALKNWSGKMQNCAKKAIAALVALSLATQAKADDEIFRNIIADFPFECGSIDDYSINAEDTYIVNFGRDNAISAYVVNPSSLRCDGESVGMCGSSGCLLKIYINEQIYDMHGGSVSSMQVTRESLIVIDHSGLRCDRHSSNAAECYSIWEWDEERGELLFLR